MSCRIAIGPEIFRLGKKPISILSDKQRNRQAKKQKGTHSESRKELEKDQVKEHEIFRLGKKPISILVRKIDKQRNRKEGTVKEEKK